MVNYSPIEALRPKRFALLFCTFLVITCFIIFYTQYVRTTQPGWQSGVAFSQKSGGNAYRQNLRGTEDLDDWFFHIKMTVLEDKVAGTLVDFPVYVDLSMLGDHFFQHVNPDGSDIRIMASDHTTELPREIVFIDVANKKGELHFKAPQLGPSVSSREFYIYYDNDAITTDYAPGDPFGAYNVWSNGYAGVWHKQHTATVADSRELNNGVANGGVTETSGFMGNGFLYDGASGSYVSVPHSALLNVTGTELTMSAWVHPEAIRQNGYVLNKRTGIAGYGMGITNEFDPPQVDPIVTPSPCAATPNTNEADRQNLKAWAITNGWNALNGKATPCFPTLVGSVKFVQYAPAFSAVNNWSYFVTTYNGTDVDNPTLNFFWNAALAGSLSNKGNIHGSATNPTQIRSTSDPLYMGVLTPPGNAPNGLPFQGTMDEVRVSNVARSADWITTEYNNQSMPSTFFTFSPPLAITISYFDAKKQDNNAVLTWTTTFTQNASHFDIERSTNGSDFIAVGKLPAPENSSTENSYSWTDYNTQPGKNYYRLKLTDKDGSFKYTKIVILDFDDWSQAKVSPNPVKGTLNIAIPNNNYNDVEITLTDVNGKVLLRRKAITGTEKVNMSSYATGIYYVRLYDIKRNSIKTFKVSRIN